MSLNEIANHFQINGEISKIESLGQGFINDTFIISLKDSDNRYVLQRKNKNVFVNIPAMMDNIVNVSAHIKGKVIAAGGDPTREAMTITETHDGKYYFIDDEGEYWAICEMIGPSISYDAANTVKLAYQGGKGIGKFQKMLADYQGELTNILPGFHDIAYRYNQWDEAIKNDAAGRVKDLTEEISWIDSRKEEMLRFWSKIVNGDIPKRISHNDTKINNILFDTNDEVLCVIDLDTVLSSTCLNDYGDAIRTYANHGAEDDKNLDNVYIDLDMFRGYTEGYLSETAEFLNKTEREYLAFSAKFITYEQVLRFLMDYINGDTYYKIASPSHNLERTHAQYRLLQSMEENFDKMQEIVRIINYEL